MSQATQSASTPAAPAEKPFWLTRSAKTIFFFLAVLTLAGAYAAF